MWALSGTNLRMVPCPPPFVPRFSEVAPPSPGPGWPLSTLSQGQIFNLFASLVSSFALF